MSSHLALEIARLAADAHHHRIHERQIISELTIIVGYAHLMETRPEYSDKLLEHLQIFSQLACANGHHKLYDLSIRILASLRESALTAA